MAEGRVCRQHALTKLTFGARDDDGLYIAAALDVAEMREKIL